MAALLSQNYVSTYQCCSKALRVRMHYLVFNHLIACIAKLTVNPNRIQNGATLTNDLLVRQTCNHFIMERNRSWAWMAGREERNGQNFEFVIVRVLRRWVVEFNLCDWSLTRRIHDMQTNNGLYNNDYTVAFADGVNARTVSWIMFFVIK